MLLFQNDDVLAVGKPPGVSMATSSRPGSGDAAVARLLAACGLPPEEGLGLVHRLDEPTSGVVLLSRNAAAHRALSLAFQERQVTKTYRTRGRGLLPTVGLSSGAAETVVEDGRTAFKDQSLYLNEQALFLNEALSVALGFRMDRSSTNGDREKYYMFPKYSAAYRFEKPWWASQYTDELKIRASWGQSGNRPRWADRDVLFANGGIIDGRGSLVSAGTLGNPNIRPETMSETDVGIDGSFLNQRLNFELTVLFDDLAVLAGTSDAA